MLCKNKIAEFSRDIFNWVTLKRFLGLNIFAFVRYVSFNKQMMLFDYFTNSFSRTNNKHN